MKYPVIMRILHWAIAVQILGLLALGTFMTPFDLDNPEYSNNLYFWHKSFGLLVLFLMLVRVLVRWRAELPPLPPGLPGHEVLASKIAHKLLYVLAIAIPVLGYVQSSAYEYSSGVHFFVVDLPELVTDSKQTFELSNMLHRVLGYCLLAVIALHVGGALKHRWFDAKENDVLDRML